MSTIRENQGESGKIREFYLVIKNQGIWKFPDKSGKNQGISFSGNQGKSGKIMVQSGTLSIYV